MGYPNSAQQILRRSVFCEERFFVATLAPGFFLSATRDYAEIVMDEPY